MTRKMVDVRLAIRSVLVQRLHHFLIQSGDHNVWPNVELLAGSDRMRLVRHPFAAIHIGYADAPHIGRAAGHAVLEELQKDLVIAAGLIMGLPRNTWKTGPRTGAGPENPELAAGRSWPVEYGCVSSHKLWTRLQSGCDPLRIRRRLAQSRHLTEGGDSADQE